MIRPTTSNVSTLSGIVANGRQAIRLVSSDPSKIPDGGFSPGRLQTGCQPRPSLPRQLIRGHSGDLLGARLSRSRTCVRWPLAPPGLFCPPASHRLLGPPPSFCRPRRVYVLMPAVSRPAEGPHFYLPDSHRLLCQPCGLHSEFIRLSQAWLSLIKPGEK